VAGTVIHFVEDSPMFQSPGNPRLKRFASLSLAGTAIVLLSACSDSPTGVDEPPLAEEAIEFQRLLVTDFEQPTARILSAATGEILTTHPLSAPATYVYGSGSGRFAGVHQRTADRVSFFDGGVWVQGNEGQRRGPNLLSFTLNESLPTHAHVNGPWMTIFFDGTGRAAWMREDALTSGQPQVAFDIQTGGPHHSGSVTVLSGSTAYFGVAPLNPAGGLPTSVEVRNARGEILASVPDCPSMHGNAAAMNTAVFGCTNGFVLILAGPSGVAASKVTPGGEMAGLGLRNAWSATGADVILGQFAALPGQPTQRVLATIEVGTGAVRRLPSLPTGVVDHWRVVEPVKGQIVILGTDGQLYIYSGSTRQLQRTVPGVVPAIPTSGARTHQVAVVEDLAAIASPTTGEVVLVNLASGTILRRIRVGGSPSRLAILGAQKNGSFRLQN